eukprot:2392195-Lingulodinium_polyedra.AAC.1
MVHMRRIAQALLQEKLSWWEVKTALPGGIVSRRHCLPSGQATIRRMLQRQHMRRLRQWLHPAAKHLVYD